MKNIFNVCYRMDMGCGGDVWRICAIKDGKSIFTSAPVSFDSEKNILKTSSGSVYHIASYSMNKEDFLKQVLSDIDNKGFEVH